MGEIINTTALGFEEQLIRIKQQSRKLIRIKNAFIQTTAAATPWSFIGVIEDAVEIKKIQIRSSFFQTKNKSRRIKTNESGFVDYFERNALEKSHSLFFDLLYCRNTCGQEGKVKRILFKNWINCYRSLREAKNSVELGRKSDFWSEKGTLFWQKKTTK